MTPSKPCLESDDMDLYPATHASHEAQFHGLRHTVIVRGNWSPEETRLLIAMRREGLQRKQIARVLLRSPKSIKNRLERVA